MKLFGDDLSVLRSEAARVAAALADVPGLVDLQVERQVLVPRVHVEIDRVATRRLGVAPLDLARDVETALAGTVVGEVLEGTRTLDLVVRAPPTSDLEALRSLPVSLGAPEGGEGRWVALGQVARIEAGTGPNQILHEDNLRRIVISANAAGRDVGSVAADVETRLGSLGPWPTGVFVELGGQFQSQRDATRVIALLSLVSLVGMIGVLYALFRSGALVAQVLINVPLALVGSVAALWLSCAPLSVATMIGFVTLSGIASRNTILLISHYVHLVAEEGEAFGPAMVIRGSLERLVPVAMTALCAGMALVPLALAAGEPGKEILTPVAQVILGGLVSSTLLDLVVTPTLFLRFGGPSLERLVAARRDPASWA